MMKKGWVSVVFRLMWITLVLALPGCRLKPDQAASPLVDFSAVRETLVFTPSPTAIPSETPVPTATPVYLTTVIPVATLDAAEIETRTQRKPISIQNTDQIELIHQSIHVSPVRAVRFTTDGTRYAFAQDSPCVTYGVGKENSVQVMDVVFGNLVSEIEDEHECSVDVIFTPDDKQLIYQWNAKLKSRNLENGSETDVLQAEYNWISSFALSRDGTWLAATDNSSIYVHNMKTGANKTLFPQYRENGKINHLIFAPGGTQIFYLDDDILHYVDIASGQDHILEIHDLNAVNGFVNIVLSPDGSQIAGMNLAYVFLIDLYPGGEEQILQDANQTVAFSPDGSLIASVLEDTNGLTVGIWNAKNKTLLTKLEGNIENIETISFSPDGTLIGTGAVNGDILVWGITGEALDAPSVQLEGEGNSMGLSNAVSKVWIAKEGKPAQYKIIFSGQCITVQTCSYSEGHSLISRRCDAAVQIMDLSTQQTIAEKAFTGFTPGSNQCPEKRSFFKSTEYIDGTPNVMEFNSWLHEVLGVSSSNPPPPEPKKNTATPVPSQPEPTQAEPTQAKPQSPTQTPQKVTIEVQHSPNPAHFKTGNASGSKYTCSYQTSVKAVGGDVRITGFQAYFSVNGQWEKSKSNDGQPWSAQDFSDWYSCGSDTIHAGEVCSDPSNWNGSSTNEEQPIKWIYYGVDGENQPVEAEQVVTCLP